MTAIFEIFNTQQDLLIQGLNATLYMVTLSTIFSCLFGIPLGILLTITEPGSLLPRPIIHNILSIIVNVGRSIPFIILIVALIPFTRTMVGTSLGAKASLVPLVVSAIPFMARLTESSLKELNRGIIEAAESMGADIFKMIWGVLLPEALPSIIRGICLTAITLVGYSAMAGAVGGGGLGDVAIRYGYHRYNTGIMMITLVMLVVLVQLIQALGNFLANYIDKRK